MGCFFLFTAGVNAGIALADAQLYRHFADGAWLGFVRSQWHDVVMAAPTVWGLLLALGELLVGVLLLRGGGAARLGWLAVVAFHLLLMLFGPGTWLWSVPVLLVLAPVVVADWPQLDPGSGPSPRAAQAHGGVEVEHER